MHSKHEYSRTARSKSLAPRIGNEKRLERARPKMACCLRWYSRDTELIPGWDRALGKQGMQLSVGMKIIARFGDALIAPANILAIDPKRNGLPRMVQVEMTRDGQPQGVQTWIQETDVLVRITSMPPDLDMHPDLEMRTIKDPETGLRY